MSGNEVRDYLRCLLCFSVASKTSFGRGKEINFEEVAYEELLRLDYIMINVESEVGEGVAMYSPEGKEIYREIPKTKEWKQNLIWILLKE